ncbi:hypothetical protein N431DRAFT_456327 [Stipitochalara longipes BDJ]|nr:hypothetical protein N431DRAFT_456327 [Stipitochalara longipes BDJ]
MASYTDYKGLPLEDSDSSYGLAEKDIERSGLVVGQKPGLRERTNILPKKFSGSVLLTIVVLVIFAISCFNRPKLVYIHDNRPVNSPTSFPHFAPSDEAFAANWTFKGWSSSNSSTTLAKCSGNPIVDLSGSDDQACTPTTSGEEDEPNDPPAGLTDIAWCGDNQFVLCLFIGAGCQTLSIQYKTDQACADGHNATYFKVVGATESCT